MDEKTALVNLNVDENLRIITIPKIKNVFGIKGDIEVNRLTFSLPRYYSGFDMSEFSVRVNYVNANKEANYYEADDVTPDEENITFSWLMGSDVTAYAGDVKFSIKLYKKQDSKVIKVFNTKSGVGTVYEGLDVEDTVTPEEQQTLLEQIEAEIKEDIKDAVNEINTAKDAFLSEINGNTIIQQVQTHDQKITDLSGLIKAGTGELSVIIGNNESTANGHQAYAEGYKTAATGNASHAEGVATKTFGNCSHAEGNTTNATGEASHAEGANTVAVGNCSHAEGSNTRATANMSHAGGDHSEVVANGRAAFAHGCYTRALQPSQFVVGYGNDPCEDSIFEVGNGILQSNDPANNGTEPYTRQNAFRVTKEGVAIAQTALKIGGTSINETQLQALLNLLNNKQ